MGVKEKRVQEITSECHFNYSLQVLWTLKKNEFLTEKKNHTNSHTKRKVAMGKETTSMSTLRSGLQTTWFFLLTFMLLTWPMSHQGE